MIISIDYEYKRGKLKYTAVKASPNNADTPLVFDSGDVVKDWYRAMKTHINDYQNEYLQYSSSVDHFFFDDKKNVYTTKFMRMEFDVVLFDGNSDGYEFIIRKDQKDLSWGDFKRHCEFDLPPAEPAVVIADDSLVKFLKKMSVDTPDKYAQFKKAIEYLYEWKG